MEKTVELLMKNASLLVSMLSWWRASSNRKAYLIL